MANKFIDYLSLDGYLRIFKDNRKSIAMVFLIFISLLVGCAPINEKIQPIIEDRITLNPETSIGQTFVADFDGLTGIQFFIEPVEHGTGEIVLEIKNQPDAKISLGRANSSIGEITEPEFINFIFSPIDYSANGYFYARLYLVGTGSVNIGIASPGSYLNGALHVNEQPQDMQVTFNLTYDSIKSILGIVKEILTWIKYLVAGIFLFAIPGWGLLSILWSGWNHQPTINKLLLSTGVSIAVYPIIFLWQNIIGFQAGTLLAWFPMIVGMLLIIWRNRKLTSFKKFRMQLITKQSLKLPVSVFILVASLIIFSRFWGVRFLDVPLWGDSYHHTMISQLIVDNGGLFNSWEPYADLSSFTYHFGFHVLAAVFHWMTGLPVTESVLWIGQILNILAVLVLFPLATKLGGNHWAGVVAILLSGLLIPLPMFFVNWGRYTQLTGLVVLPVMMYLVWDLSESEYINWRSFVIPALLIVGISLSHYRVLFFGLMFMLILIFVNFKRAKIKPVIIKFTCVAFISFLLFFPWFLKVYGSTILQIFTNQITTSPGALSQSALDYNTIGNLTIYLPSWAWIVAGVAVILGTFVRPKAMILIVVWSILLLIATNPNWVGLPGTGTLSNFALFIAIYIPVGLIVGISVGAIIDYILKQNKSFYFFASIGMITLILCLSILGTVKRMDDINPNTFALVTRPDVRASIWIKDNLPEQAKFLVNSFLAYDGTLAVGSDGGIWLPLLAERRTNLPPITYGFEDSFTEDYIQLTNQLVSMTQDPGPGDPNVIEKLQDQNITHVYIGQRRGGVNYSGSGVLNPEELSANPHYEQVYHQDLVWIFRILP